MHRFSKPALAVALVGVLTIIALTAPASAQNYVMYETAYLKPKLDKLKVLKETLAKHNRQYHAANPHRAQIFSVVNGPRSGQLVWAMGPTMFADLDNRPAANGHDDDWQNKVLPLLEDSGDAEYWRLDADMSYVPDTDEHKYVRVRLYDVKPFEEYRFKKLLKNIKEVLEVKKYPRRWNVYHNRFVSGEGRDWASVMSFDKWADLDDDRNFEKDYEAVHGDGSWRQFLNEWEDVVESMEDEYREFLPELSGGESSSR